MGDYYGKTMNVQVTGNIFEDGTNAIAGTENSEGIIIAGNTFKGNRIGIGVGNTTKGLQISGNIFTTTVNPTRVVTDYRTEVDSLSMTLEQILNNNTFPDNKRIEAYPTGQSTRAIFIGPAV